MTEEKKTGKKKRLETRTYEQRKDAIRKYQKKKERVFVWLDHDEKEEVRRMAAAEGKSMADFIRSRALPPKEDDKE